MDELIKYFGQNWPNITFYAVLIICVIFGFKWIISNVINEYKSLLQENRENNKLSNEETQTLLNEYKQWNSQINAELSTLYERLENLKKQLTQNETQIQSLKMDLQKVDNVLYDFSLFIKNQSKQADNIELFETLRTETKALFSDRDRLKEDLEIVWKVLLRTTPRDSQFEENIKSANFSEANKK